MFWQPKWKKRSQTRLWGLAAGGLLTKLNNESFDQLASRLGRDGSRHCLREWWDVDHFLDLKRTFEWLWSEGHSRSCIKLCDAFFPPGEPTETTSYEITSELYGFMEAHLDQLRTSRLVAWDMSRLINVARWGYTANYIRGAEAWAWIQRSARRLQESFCSWKAVGQDFILGYQFWWYSIAASYDMDLISPYKWMISDSQSPWVKLAWNTPLVD